MVQLWLPEELWAALPQEMRDGGEVRCLVALISQGINAQQTVANAVGECELQARHTTRWRHTTSLACAHRACTMHIAGTYLNLHA